MSYFFIDKYDRLSYNYCGYWGLCLMTNVSVSQLQETFNNEYILLKNKGIILNEEKEALLFAKILIRQRIYTNRNITYCADNEFFVSKNPAGYAVTGYYTFDDDPSKKRNPFSLTVSKVNGLWYPSTEYVAADTKTGSSAIIIWILLSLGCTLMGILTYFIISAVIGI